MTMPLRKSLHTITIIVLQAVLDKTFMQNYKQAKISLTPNLQRNSMYCVFDTV